MPSLPDKICFSDFFLGEQLMIPRRKTIAAKDNIAHYCCYSFLETVKEFFFMVFRFH